MGEARPLGTVVFDKGGALLQWGQGMEALTGFTTDEGSFQEAWCLRLFPDPLAQSIVRGVFAAMAGGEPAAEGQGFEFCLPYRAADGAKRQGRFTLALAPRSEESGAAYFILTLQERREPHLASGPREGPSPLDPYLDDIQEAQRGLMALVEESQNRVMAATHRIRGNQAAMAHLWDELFQEAFALARLRDLVTAIGEKVEAAAEVCRSDAHQVDPDRPLTGVPLGRPVALPLGLSLHKLERFWILSTLQAVHGNRSDCARHLDIALRTVRNKLGEYQSAGFSVPNAASGRRPKPRRSV